MKQLMDITQASCRNTPALSLGLYQEVATVAAKTAQEHAVKIRRISHMIGVECKYGTI